MIQVINNGRPLGTGVSYLIIGFILAFILSFGIKHRKYGKIAGVLCAAFYIIIAFVSYFSTPQYKDDLKYSLISLAALSIYFYALIHSDIKEKKEKRAEELAISVARNSSQSIDYMEGHDFEYWCAALLKDIGFQNVSITKGSGDQGVDIIAEKNGGKYAIQCKRYNKPLGNKPVQEVYAGKAIYNCDVAVVMTNSTFTDGAKEAATKTGVILWDRKQLENFMEIRNL